MNILNQESKEFLDVFFKEHKMFFSDDIDWKLNKKDNLKTRLSFLFSKFGFFETSLKELDDNYMDEQSFYKRGDNPNFHENKRYIIQEVIDSKISNPIHISLKPINSQYGVVVHPGHTRHQASVFLKKNLNSAFFYMNKKYYNNDKIFNGLKEIKSFNDMNGYWKPRPLSKEQERVRKVPNVNVCNFVLHHSDIDGINRITKYHTEHESFVLKLWSWITLTRENENKIRRVDLLHTTKYLDYIRESSKDITDILFEKKLTIYTDSNEDVKSYFKNIQEYLLQKANEQLLFVSNKHEQFDFDVVVVDKKPDNISKLNKNKGFAIWIDKDILGSITRDIYEFLVFTRKDIKLAETEDKKISVVNCRNTGDKKWTIHKEFYL